MIAKALDKLLKSAEIDDSDEEWEMVFRTPAMEDALEDTNFQGVTVSMYSMFILTVVVSRAT